MAWASPDSSDAARSRGLIPLHAYQLPYGATVVRQEGRIVGTQFLVASRHATKATVLLYDQVQQREPSHRVPMECSGECLWRAFVPGDQTKQLYHFQLDGPFDPERGFWFDGSARLLDPYAKALAGEFLHSTDGIIRPPKCVVLEDHFDWRGDRPLGRPWNESVIYEMHVGGFTSHPSSRSHRPGTFLGLLDRVDHLKRLGVTAVELMPVQDFLEGSVFGGDGGRKNYWGYDPLAFFAPHRHYAVSSHPGAQVAEFKELVRSLHAEGLEVILDIVLNHTCEQGASGTVLSWKGIDASAYYLMHGQSHQFSDYSGCGNAIHAHDPVCHEMLISVLRHWVHEYHVDGFRFDLASILNRTSDGLLVEQSPLIEAIQRDPLLSGTKWIAEAWDAAGAYQVGTFGGEGWSEWNGRFRDDLRRFWRGDPGMDGAAATRFSGSSDLYQTSGRPPSASINFVASHDGYTLADLVAYEEKHNEANGWDNRDGENQNFSCNHGVEGPTNDPEIAHLRCRQQRNFFVNLLLAKGVPMWTAGDEGGRTQSGNNNAYCQDNEISWIDWERMVQQDALVEGVARLVKLRKSLSQLETDRFFRGAPEGPSPWPDILWLDPDGRNRTWDTGARHLACWIAPEASVAEPDAVHSSRHLLVWFHAGDQPQEFRLPEGSDEVQWNLVVDTTVPIDAPWVFNEAESRVVPHGVQRTLPPFSSAVLIGTPVKKDESPLHYGRPANKKM